MTSVTINEYSHPDDSRKPHWEYIIGEDKCEQRQHKLQCSSPRTPPSGTAWLRHYLVGVPQQFVSDLFLPIDYPHSVRSEYMAYQICDSLQGLSSYLRGVVASSAVLEAAGVGNAEATAMSAAMTWALRDGLGMVGGLAFSYTTSFYFDAHVKEFRLFADVINDVGLTLDMLAPQFSNVLYISSVATMCKIMCGISAGATKGSITQHFCLRGNMADLNAKEGTQETLMSLIGMICGVYLAKYLSRLEGEQGKAAASSWSWSVFNTLTLLHVYINYRGVKLLRLRTLNRQRAKEALGGLVLLCVKNLDNLSEPTDSSARLALSQIPGPDTIPESLLESTYSMLMPGRMRLNDSFGKFALSADALVEQLSRQKYVVACDGNVVRAALLTTSQDKDELRAFLHVRIVEEVLRRGTFDSSTIQKSQQFIDVLEKQGFGIALMEELGWDVNDRLYLGFGRSRISAVLASSSLSKDQ